MARWPLRPAFSAHTEVVYFKGIRKGMGVGYMHTWNAPSDGWLATLPVGYGDGYPRILSNRAEVLIGGKRYPIVGNISMDMCMADVTGLNVRAGDEVEIFGSNISIEEIAVLCNTIPYEILTSIPPRVKRIYVNE